MHVSVQGGLGGWVLCVCEGVEQFAALPPAHIKRSIERSTQGNQVDCGQPRVNCGCQRSTKVNPSSHASQMVTSSWVVFWCSFWCHCSKNGSSTPLVGGFVRGGGAAEGLGGGVSRSGQVTWGGRVAEPCWDATGRESAQGRIEATGRCPFPDPAPPRKLGQQSKHAQKRHPPGGAPP